VFEVLEKEKFELLIFSFYIPYWVPF